MLEIKAGMKDGMVKFEDCDGKERIVTAVTAVYMLYGVLEAESQYEAFAFKEMLKDCVESNFGLREHLHMTHHERREETNE